ncbi:MAG: DUF1887 family protein [Gammaproteobacteria bacterium]|nr:DUF1887 family protein [Gammaproteobacteria bacterium]MBU1654444.1 DUF1887 family protein [Gammaproteobacteria bacterium]MBU1960694.1 DUF1887 family protein [Gammaproteobacteria bacterium]
MSFIHLCLVSDQPVPSLTPLIDPALGVQRAVLVAAPERVEAAEGLARALDHYRIPAEIIRLGDGYDLGSLETAFGALRDRFPEGLAVNITGGTKLMAIAAWESFNRPQDRIYYVQLRSDSIDWLRPVGLPSHPVGDRLRIEPYLLAQGARYRKEVPPLRTALNQGRQQLAERFLRNKQFHAKLLSFTEKIAGSSFTEISRLKDPLALHLTQAGLLSHDIEQSRKAMVAFNKGGWLEELIFTYIDRMRTNDPLIHDLVRRLVILRGSQISPLENEIDVACLRDNTLFLIECKSGRLFNRDEQQEILRKLAFLRDRFGGLRSRCMLVSRRGFTEPIRERARELRVDLLVASEPEKLRQGLQQWIQSVNGARP